MPLPAAFVEGLQALPNNLFGKFQVRTSAIRCAVAGCGVTSHGEDKAD